MVKEIVERVEHCRLVRCGLIAFGASSLDHELQFDVWSIDYEEVFRARATIALEILKRFEAEGIDFAYPTQTSFTAAPDGTLVLPYPDVTMLATDDAPDRQARST